MSGDLDDVLQRDTDGKVTWLVSTVNDIDKRFEVIETNQLQTWELDEIKNRISWLEANQHGH